MSQQLINSLESVIAAAQATHPAYITLTTDMAGVLKTELESNLNRIQSMNRDILQFMNAEKDRIAPASMHDFSQRMYTGYMKNITDKYELKKWQDLNDESKDFDLYTLMVYIRALSPGWKYHAKSNISPIVASDVHVGTLIVTDDISRVTAVEPQNGKLRLYMESEITGKKTEISVEPDFIGLVQVKPLPL